MFDAGASQNWDAVLRWELRMDELVAGQDQKTIFEVLQVFACAFSHTKKFDKAGLMWVRCAEACGALKLFSLHVGMLERAGTSFLAGGDSKNAALWFESARDVSRENEFVSMESKFCTKLGGAFTEVGRISEGVEQHRRAWAVAQRVQDGISHGRASLERTALRFLVMSLCEDGQLEEAGTLFTRLREGGTTPRTASSGTTTCEGVCSTTRETFQQRPKLFKPHWTSLDSTLQCWRIRMPRERSGQPKAL